MPSESIDLIANFAAVHREPGQSHMSILNVSLELKMCDWAEKIACETIIFSSSIAPYGPSEDERDEQSIPVPTTAYGALN